MLRSYYYAVSDFSVGGRWVARRTLQPGTPDPRWGAEGRQPPRGGHQWLPWGVKKPLEMRQGGRRGRVLVPWARRSGSSWPGHILALAFPASAVFPPPGVTWRPSHPLTPWPEGPSPSPFSSFPAPFLPPFLLSLLPSSSFIPSLLFLSLPSFLLFLSKPSRFGVTTGRCRSGSFQSFPSPASPPEVTDCEACPPCSCPSLLLILGVIGLHGDPDILNKT